MPPDVAAEQPAATSGTDFGLNAEEKAAYDAMRSDPAPTGDPGHVDPEVSPEPAPAAPASGDPAAPAVAEPGAAPAPVEADDDDEADPAALPDGTRPPKRVSYNKFKRIEDEAKKTAADLAAERAKNAEAATTQARLDERLRLINEALQPPAAAPQDDDPEPDPEADIFGHNAWLKRQLVKTQTTFGERINQIEAGRQAETGEQQLASNYIDDAQRFAQTEPNFGPAYSYLMQVRTAQLASYHFGKDLTDPNTPPLTPQEVAKIKGEVAREERQLVAQALKAGKSPAAAVYAMARMTGYRPAAASAAPAAANGAAAPAANGAAPVAAAVAAAAPLANGAAKPTVRAEIDRIKSGQEAALSLSHGGGAPAPVLNAEKLANMPEEEFGALLDQMSRGELKRAMGGGP